MFVLGDFGMGYGCRWFAGGRTSNGSTAPDGSLEHRATSGSSPQSADGNVAPKGVGSTELPEATTLALDRMRFLMEIS
jgi:hypothetical protein